MRLVIADTGPVNYLILIGSVEILPRLFERIVLPTAVEKELAAADAPAEVKTWIATPPAWLEIVNAPAVRILRAFTAEKPQRSHWQAQSEPISC